MLTVGIFAYKQTLKLDGITAVKAGSGCCVVFIAQTTSGPEPPQMDHGRRTQKRHFLGRLKWSAVGAPLDGFIYFDLGPPGMG
jgi:hypothetical protein